MHATQKLYPKKTWTRDYFPRILFRYTVISARLNDVLRFFCKL
jgi:hypothetical protein